MYVSKNYSSRMIYTNTCVFFCIKIKNNVTHNVNYDNNKFSHHFKN